MHLKAFFVLKSTLTGLKSFKIEELTQCPQQGWINFRLYEKPEPSRLRIAMYATMSCNPHKSLNSL